MKSGANFFLWRNHSLLMPQAFCGNLRHQVDDSMELPLRSYLSGFIRNYSTIYLLLQLLTTRVRTSIVQLQENRECIRSARRIHHRDYPGHSGLPSAQWQRNSSDLHPYLEYTHSFSASVNRLESNSPRSRRKDHLSRAIKAPHTRSSIFETLITIQHHVDSSSPRLPRRHSRLRLPYSSHRYEDSE